MRRALELRRRTVGAERRLTGRTLRYGYHLDARRAATLVVNVGFTPRELNDWGALGGIVGRLAGDYWQVPVLVGVERVPGSDEMKYFWRRAGELRLGRCSISPASATPRGAAPRRRHCSRAIAGNARRRRGRHPGVRTQRCAQAGKIDLVVFSAPQLSLVEMAQVAGLLDGRHASIPLLVITSPQVKPDADRMGLTARIEAAGGTVLRHVLLPELRPRDGGGERLEAAGDQLGEARQHHRRLRLPAGAVVDGGVRRAAVATAGRTVSGKVFFATAGMGRKVQARRWSPRMFSARYDLDRARGVFARPEHKLAGESYVGRVLVLDAAKGGRHRVDAARDDGARHRPAALVLNAVNPIMVQGAALADFTMISGFDLDITQAIPNGIMVEVDLPERGRSSVSSSSRDFLRGPRHLGRRPVRKSEHRQCVVQRALASAAG